MSRPAIVKWLKISVLAASATLIGAAASAQTPPSPALERPAIASALQECETGAREGVLTGRALGACDVALRSDDLSDVIRARVLVNRGVIALKRNEAGPARSDLEQAVSLAPDLAEAWLSLSAARIKARDLSGAVDAARRALDLDVSEPALAHFNIAIAEETAGRYDPAYESYLRAAELAPDNALIQAQPARFLRHQAAQPPAAG
jgi:tetratricopeptide (TPR) repeat protein